MTSPSEHSDPTKLDAYLDGSLPDQEREAMSREIAASGPLQAEVKLQRRIDESLRKSFAPSNPPGNLVATLRQSAPTQRAPMRMPRRRVALIAAATAATLVWGMLAWQFFTRKSDSPVYNPERPLATIYKACVADGFKPTWVCEDDREFASTFQSRQGQGLLLAAMPKGSKMEGLAYYGGLSKYTTTMLARVDGSPVMVFVDRADADTHPASPAADTNLHLFRKELGSLVLYELTPLDRPKVMDHLYLADVPPPK